MRAALPQFPAGVAVGLTLGKPVNCPQSSFVELG